MTRAWPAGTPDATLGDAVVLAAWPADRADPDEPVPWPDDPPSCSEAPHRRRAWLGLGIASGLAALVAFAAGLALLLG